MQAFVVGLVFSVLLVIGMLTVYIQSDALKIGYDIEAKRRAAAALHRENESLRFEIAVMTTPSSLLPSPSVLPTEEGAGPGPFDPVMPKWNVVWIDPVDDPIDEAIDVPDVDLARRDDSSDRGARVSFSEVQHSVEKHRE